MNDAIYRDLCLDLKRHPMTNDIMMKTNLSDIKQSLRFLFSTSFYERPFKPDYGVSLNAIMFSPLDAYNLYTIENNIKQAIAKYEPRISLTSVSAVKDTSTEGSIVITIEYTVVNLGISDTYVYIINRLR